ncbi:hypothetical protein [Acidisphaera sp. S103]|uniref:hypothetical protein n=1 Tax=Acidisphaera sp. S103 TaxID=1747223 RepID=UPI00131DED6D|nr:hypothetical protein [Acidisphaera sp. S103]
MVSVAFWVLAAAVVAGSVLALWHLRGVSRPPLVAGTAHAVVGAVGLGLLLLALGGPARGVAAGVGSFGAVAAGLFTVALLTGFGLLLLQRKGVVMAIHAGIAITGFVMVMAWVALG